MVSGGQVTTTTAAPEEQAFDVLPFSQSLMCGEGFGVNQDTGCVSNLGTLYSQYKPANPQQAELYDGLVMYAMGRSYDGCYAAALNKHMSELTGNFNGGHAAQNREAALAAAQAEAGQCTIQTGLGQSVSLLDTAQPIAFMGQPYSIEEWLKHANELATRNIGTAETVTPTEIPVPPVVIDGARETATINGVWDPILSPLINDWIINLYREAMMQQSETDRMNPMVQEKIGTLVIAGVREHRAGDTPDEIKAFMKWLSMAYVLEAAKDDQGADVVTLSQMPEEILGAGRLGIVDFINNLPAANNESDDAAKTALVTALRGIYEVRRFFAPEVQMQIRVDETNNGQVAGHIAGLNDADLAAFLNGVNTQIMDKLIPPVAVVLGSDGGLNADGTINIDKMAEILSKYSAVAEYTVADNGATVTIVKIELVQRELRSNAIPEALLQALDGYSSPDRYFAIARIWGDITERDPRAAAPGEIQNGYVENLISQLQGTETPALQLTYVRSVNKDEHTAELGHGPMVFLQGPFAFHGAAGTAALDRLLDMFERARVQLPAEMQNDPAAAEALGQAMLDAEIEDERTEADDDTQTLAEIIGEQSAPAGSPPGTNFGIYRFAYMTVPGAERQENGGYGASGTPGVTVGENGAIRVTLTEEGLGGGTGEGTTTRFGPHLLAFDAEGNAYYIHMSDNDGGGYADMQLRYEYRPDGSIVGFATKARLFFYRFVDMITPGDPTSAFQTLEGTAEGITIKELPLDLKIKLAGDNGGPSHNIDIIAGITQARPFPNIGHLNALPWWFGTRDIAGSQYPLGGLFRYLAKWDNGSAVGVQAFVGSGQTTLPIDGRDWVFWNGTHVGGGLLGQVQAGPVNLGLVGAFDYISGGTLDGNFEGTVDAVITWKINEDHTLEAEFRYERVGLGEVQFNQFTPSLQYSGLVYRGDVLRDLLTVSASYHYNSNWDNLMSVGGNPGDDCVDPDACATSINQELGNAAFTILVQNEFHLPWFFVTPGIGLVFSGQDNSNMSIHPMLQLTMGIHTDIFGGVGEEE